jgi:hypothetical protein
VEVTHTKTGRSKIYLVPDFFDVCARPAFEDSSEVPLDDEGINFARRRQRMVCRPVDKAQPPGMRKPLQRMTKGR